MGYIRKAPIVKMVFDDEEYEGLEIRMTSMPMGEFLVLFQGNDGDSNEGDSEEGKQDKDAAKFEKMIRELSTRIISWNLETEDGWPVPADFDGLKTLDLVFIRDLLHAYRVSLFGVDTPLPQSSTSGGQSVEGSIPMELLSESQ